MREWAKISEEDRRIVRPFLDEVPVRIAAMARALGMEVKTATLRPRISGQIQPSPDSPSGYRIRVNRHEAKTRQRFTIAHEIAHYLLHRDLIGDGIEDSILYRSTLSDPIEAQANRLAAQLLMPESSILKSLRRHSGRANLSVAAMMAEEFNVSEAAMKIRIGLG